MTRPVLAAVSLLVATVAFSMQPSDAASYDGICAKAKAAYDTVPKIPLTNFAELASAAGRATTLSTDCAAAEFATSSGAQIGFASMAMSFHTASIAAMAMHIEGEDNNASRLIRLTIQEEANYLRLARKSGIDASVDILEKVSEETRTLAERIP